MTANRLLRLASAIAMVFSCGSAMADAPADVPGENAYDTTAGGDESLLDVRIRNHRWPDCYSLESVMADIFRLEGLSDEPDATEAKAFATWKWMMTLMSISGGRIYEGHPSGPKVLVRGDRDTQQIEVRTGDKLLMVYGVHECGGVSRVLAHMWTAAGFIGYQEASSGHSTAALRYPDTDGIWRMHSFNPQGRSFYFHPELNRVGSRRLPAMRGVEYKGGLPPMEHTLRTSLRRGETLCRRWQNDGYVQMTDGMAYWKKRPAHKQIDIHCVAGQEDQTLLADMNPATFRSQLWPASSNVACSEPAAEKATLHPAEPGKPAAFIYRLASPYVAIECKVQAKLLKTESGDICRIAFSNNQGKTWHTVYEKADVGSEDVTFSIGRELYYKPAPSITSHYQFLIKVELQTAGQVRQVGINDLKVTVHRQLNMRALPNLMPGENVFHISARGPLPDDLALQLVVDYEVNGQAMTVRRVVRDLPHYFRVDVNGLPAEKLNGPHYLAKWGGTYEFNLPAHPLRMRAVTLSLVPAAGEKLDASMPAEQAEAFFAKAYPTPNFDDRRIVDKTKIPRHESEVSGFLPQIPRTKDQPTDPTEYYNWLVENIGTTDARLAKLDPGVDPVEYCIRQLPGADHCRTVGLANVLAHFADKRALPALLDKWNQAPRRAPGDRYIADALAAIGDRSAVPALAGKVRSLRFDYRVHVARALGILGGEQARQTLQMLVKEDPNISVRGEAQRALAKLNAM